jgi:carboxyl-terminal processing protease
VADLRKICPPGETAPEADVDLAVQLLRDRALYAHAVQSASIEAAARP